MDQKPVPDLFFILVNNKKQPLHAINCTRKSYQQQKGPGTSDQSLFRLQLEYLKNKKIFLAEIRNIFHSFEGLSLGEKIKI